MGGNLHRVPLREVVNAPSLNGDCIKIFVVCIRAVADHGVHGGVGLWVAGQLQLDGLGLINAQIKQHHRVTIALAKCKRLYQGVSDCLGQAICSWLGNNRVTTSLSSGDHVATNGGVC